MLNYSFIIHIKDTSVIIIIIIIKYTTGLDLLKFYLEVSQLCSWVNVACYFLVLSLSGLVFSVSNFIKWAGEGFFFFSVLWKSLYKTGIGKTW